MEIILSKQCESLTGSLGKGFGYFIQRRRGQDGKYHFFSQRSKHPPIPIDGHLRFIFTCAELAQMRLHISDIKVTNRELFEALREANLPAPAFLNWNNVETYNASDIINYRRDYLPCIV